MSTILREWLIHQLGGEVHSLHPNNLISKFQNGVLIGKILQNYDIVSSKDLSLLVDQDDEETKNSNFWHLKNWLNIVNISLDKDTVAEIIRGESSVIFGFLYKLCFILECPNNLNILGHARKLYKSLGSYDFSHISFTSGKIVDFQYQEQHLKRIDNKSYRKPKTPNEYDKIAYFQCSLPKKINRWTARGDQSCKRRYIFDIKTRKEHVKIYELWRKETTHKYLQTNLEINTRHNQDILRNKSISNRLNCMSDCEEKLLNKINDTRIVTKKRKTFSVETDVKLVKNNIVHKSYDISEENKLNLKNKLMERYNDSMKDEKTIIMKTVVRDLIDLSMRNAVYNKTYGYNIPKYLRGNWIHMFIKGRPLINTLDDTLGLLLDPVYVAENKPRSDVELTTQSVLDQKDTLDYLERTNGWSQNEIGLKSDSHTTVYRALGFLVYDIFTLYYALPPSLVSMDGFVFGPVFGVLSCEIKESLKQDICNALIKRNILPVLPIAALQYCSRAYCKLTDNEELLEMIENPEDTDDNNKDPSDTYVVIDNILVHENPTLLNEKEKSKQTQTNCQLEKLEELLECGKTAFFNIYSGKPLPKHCLIDCVLYYIKAKKMDGGCVFLGFSKEDIMTLEERLANRQSPPFGSHSFMKDIHPTILAPFKGPDLIGIGRYGSSFTRYLKIVSEEYVLDNFNDLHEYYKSHNNLTLLQRKNKNLDLDNPKIELICDVLAGQIVNWSEESNWVNCIYDMHKDQGDYEMTTELSKFSSVQTLKEQTSVFKRKRLNGKSEFDFLDYISASKVNMISNELAEGNTTKPEEVKSKHFNVQIGADIGAVLVTFWTAMETNFVHSMESCFFYRRIIFSNQMPYMSSINNYINEILKQQNIEKIELVKCLQSDLLKIPNDALSIPDVTRKVLSTVNDTRAMLTQLTNQKIDSCKQFIKNENIDRMLDSTMASMLQVYKLMLQTEVDRTVNTILFIHSYMSKVYNKKLTLSVIPNHIGVILTKDLEFKVNKEVENLASIEYYFKWFDATISMINNNIKATLKATYEWLEEMKKVQSANLLESSTVYLKIWKFLIDKENFRSADQLKLILARFHEDIKEIDSYVVQYQTDINKRINDCLQKEQFGVECICNLFEAAINEKQYVRHEIIFIDNCFYLNAENVLQPSNPPPCPFPLLEPEDLSIVTIHNLKKITNKLAAIFPFRRISLVALSSWLKYYLEYHPEIEWFNTTNLVLRTMFGFNVNFVDWSDFIIHCLELPYPNVEELLDLKHQYMELENNRANNLQENYTEGTINKDEFDSVLLWYQKMLPPNPSIFFRFIKIKELLFKTFSIGGKLDYVAMLLALCKEDHSIMGLTKAISLITNHNIMVDLLDSSNHGNERNSIQLPIETLKEILIISLKNYMDPISSEIEDLVTSILNVYSDMHKQNGETFSVLQLLQNDELKLLSEIGYRFNSRPLSSIVNSLK